MAKSYNANGTFSDSTNTYVIYYTNLNKQEYYTELTLPTKFLFKLPNEDILGQYTNVNFPYIIVSLSVRNSVQAAEREWLESEQIKRKEQHEESKSLIVNSEWLKTAGGDYIRKKDVQIFRDNFVHTYDSTIYEMAETAEEILRLFK